MRKKDKFKSTNPIKDKVAKDIINALCEIFPGHDGFYIAPVKKKVKKSKK